MSAAAPSRTWIVAKADRAARQRLVADLGIPPLLAHLLLLRGLVDPEEARRFLDPQAAPLCDPFSLTDMRAAVERIAAARERREHVRVFGDYDVDGLSGTAVLLLALRRYGIARATYALPNRLDEGYGLNAEQIAQAKEDGVHLVVTVDNGIAAHDAARRARELGLDLIVTDHHTLPERLPEALAIVNPKREAAGHPLREISGSAVAFKLACALNGDEANLDLTALGIVADIVPLVGENRVLVTRGLTELANTHRPGLRRLAQVAKVALERVTSENIAFQLGPRLNAGGRLGEADRGLRLLLTEDEDEAAALADELEQENLARRTIERDLFEQIAADLDARLGPEQCTVVASGEGWHPGVIGIVAARVQRRYHRPVVLIAVDANGEGRASGRSMDGFDLVEAIGTTRDLLVRYGGHSMAAGLTIEKANIPAFTERFEATARARMPGGPLEATLAIDAQVSLGSLTPTLIHALERLQPFGQMNRRPVFCTYGVELMPGSLRELNGGHLRFAVRDGGSTRAVIAFGMAHLNATLAQTRQVDIAFTAEFNTWRGEESVQLQLKEVRIP